MVKNKGMSLESALSTINTKRPEIKPSSSYCFQLQEYEKHVIAKRRFQNSKMRYFVEKLFEFFDIGFLRQSDGERNNNNIIEKVSHNWIQLTIYFLLTLLFFRFLIQFILLNFREEEDEEESSRLPCS